MKKIYFHDLNIKSGLKDKLRLRTFLYYLFKDERKPINNVEIIFCSDSYLLKLNKKYLNHDFYTDTITFTLQKKPIIGEAYISIDRIKENAKDLKVTYQNELIRVIIHSCLHLCDYNDKTAKTALKMISTQERYLKKWLVSRETQIGG